MPLTESVIQLKRLLKTRPELTKAALKSVHQYIDILGSKELNNLVDKSKFLQSFKLLLNFFSYLIPWY